MPRLQFAFEFEGKKAVGEITSIDRAALGTKRSVLTLQKALAAAGIAFSAVTILRGLRSALRAAVTTAAEFEQLRVQLKTVTGSAEDAGRAFEMISRFTARTPFQLRDVTGAFINLQAKGFAPTRRELAAIGDLAAAFGKDIGTATQAITQAAFGEAEMLKQFGIILRYEGEQAKLTFKGITETISRDSQSIFDALIRLSQQNAFGATADQADTLKGAVSTLKDNFDLLADTIGRRVNPALTDLAKQSSDVLSKFNVVLEDALSNLEDFGGEAEQAGARGKSALLALLPPLAFVASAIDTINRRFKQLGGGGQDSPLAPKRFAQLAQLTAKWRAQMELVPVDRMQEALEASVAALEAAEQPARTLREIMRDQADAALAIRERIEAMREALREVARIRLDNIESLAIAGPGLPGSLAKLPLIDTAELRAQIDAGLELAKPDAEDFASDFSRELQAAIFSGVVQAFEDSRSAVLSIFQGLAQAIGGMIAQQVGTAIGGAAGGPIGAVAGGVAAGLLSNLARDIFSDEPDLIQRFLGAVNIFAPAAETLLAAAVELREASRAIRERFVDLSRMLGGALLTGAGGGLGVPGSPGGLEGGTGGAPGESDRMRLKSMFGGLFADIIVSVQQMGDQFHVSIQGMVSGVGDTIESAVRDLMDRFAQTLPQLIEQGFVSLQGIPELLAGILAQGAATFDELQANLETGLRALQATLGDVGFAVFQWAADMRAHVSELARLGVDQSDILTVIREGFHDFLNQLVGADLFRSLVNIRQVARDLRQRFIDMGLAGDELAARMREARMALHLFNRQARLDVLGQLADMARQFGIAAREVRQIERARVRIQFAILRIQLQSLGLWERFADLFRRVRRAALDAANSIGRAARELGGLGGAAQPTGGLGSTAGQPLNVRVTNFEELSPDQLLANWRRLMDRLREFRESLRFGPFAPGTPAEKARGALAAVLEAARLGKAGRRDLLADLPSLMQEALQLAAAAFGTSTDAFREFYDTIQAAIAGVLGEGPLPTAQDALRESVNTQTQVLSNQLWAARQERRTHQDETNRRLDRLIALQEAELRLAPV